MNLIGEATESEMEGKGFYSLEQMPARFKVVEVKSQRYADNRKPQSWDKRIPGNDIVVTEDGRLLNLFSDGGQSPPKPGWVILVSGGDTDSGYLWTLYGIPGSNS